MNFLRNLIISAMFTFNRYMPAQDTGVLQDTSETEIEPVKEQDEWNKWLHHDDVTLEEEAMLCSDDPEQILMAREAIEVRQAEVQAMMEDKPAFRAMFQEGYLKDADLDREQTPMHERAGWEDDELPETFIGINPVTGYLEEIRFDDLPEWQGIDNYSDNTPEKDDNWNDESGLLIEGQEDHY